MRHRAPVLDAVPEPGRGRASPVQPAAARPLRALRVLPAQREPVRQALAVVPVRPVALPVAPAAWVPAVSRERRAWRVNRCHRS